MHAQRWRKHGDPTKLIHLPRTECLADGCVSIRSGGSNYCDPHEYRAKRYGDPLAEVRRKRHPEHIDGKCQCTLCGEWRPLAEFHVARANAYGHAPRCKHCDADTRRADPDRAYETSRRRRVRLATGGPEDRGITRSALRGRHGDACHHCRERLTFEPPKRGQYIPTYATFDHLIPVSKGGLHVWSNVVLACFRCNLSRGGRMVEDWTPPTQVLRP